MSQHDAHVQHTWTLTRSGAEPISIDLWTDGYSVRVDGGPDDGLDSELGRAYIETELLPRYTMAGYTVSSNYAVNDPADHTEEYEEGPDLDSRPGSCPQCASKSFEYVDNHVTDFREGAAWLCNGPSCAWGVYVTV